MATSAFGTKSPRETPAREEARATAPPAHAARRAALRWAVLLVAAGAALALAQLWIPLVLAGWIAIVVRPLHASIARRVRGSNRAASVVTVVVVLLALTPLVVIALSLTASIADLITRLQSTSDGREAIASFFSSDAQLPAAEQNGALQIADFLQRHGTSAMSAVRTLFGAVTAVAVGLFVFVFSFYTFLVDGRRGYAWAVEHSPLEPGHLVRFASAFEETGRGLLISFGFTSLIQGSLSTIGYLIIGVPQALMLGLLTSIGSFIPIIGTGLVWVPVTLVMFAAQRPAAGVAVIVLGLVVSLLDNFVRPALSRYGRLELPTFVIFTAMLGGVAAFGGGGLILGPLLVRMSIEGLRMWRERATPPDLG